MVAVQLERESDRLRCVGSGLGWVMGTWVRLGAKLLPSPCMLDPTTEPRLLQVKPQFRPQHKWTVDSGHSTQEAELSLLFLARKTAANFVRSEPALESRSSVTTTDDV